MSTPRRKTGARQPDPPGNRKTGTPRVQTIGPNRVGALVRTVDGRDIVLTYQDLAGIIGELLSSSSSSGAGGHLHGLERLLGDGATTTFNLLDFAEYLQLVAVDGLIVDPSTYALSADRSQIVFDTAPAAGKVIVITYVIANV